MLSGLECSHTKVLKYSEFILRRSEDESCIYNILNCQIESYKTR